MPTAPADSMRAAGAPLDEPCRRGRTVVRMRLPILLIVAALAAPARAAVITVPDDVATVQGALNAAMPGDTVRVRQQATPYVEKITFPRSGDAVLGPIVLTAVPGERPVLDGTGVAGDDLVLIDHRSDVQLIGFELRNNLGVHDGSGVRILGSGARIAIRDNVIHDVRGRDAMGITVYGTEATPISDLLIDGNEIYDCEPYRSEALTLNGNVAGFAVTNNVVRDVNNIGIDFIGGETDIQPDPALVARDGVCRGNVVLRANEPGGGFAGGIYVDGGRDIVIERNLVAGADLGIEVGAENAGIVTRRITVRDNVLLENVRAGLVFGGFAAGVGRVRDSEFRNNTTWHNDTSGSGFGELWIQFATDNVVRNNIFVSTGQNLLLLSEAGNVNNQLDYNLFHAAAGAAAARFVWQGTAYAGFAAYRAGSGQDAHGLFADPLLRDPAAGDVHLRAGSPAVDAGDPALVPAADELDLDGAARRSGGRVDIGADELTCGNGVPDPGEDCDDGNAADGDGCDHNCTATGCGNGIVTAGEQCDDGNTAAGDCCDPTCAVERAGSPCDDGDPCRNDDVCDGAGACAGAAVPLAACKGGASGTSRLLLRDASSAAGDTLTWKCAAADATTLGELGDPSAGAGYQLCLYDAAAVAQPRLAAAAPGGGGWKVSSSGVTYRSQTGAPAGLRIVKVKAGGAGRAKVLVKGKGAQLTLPDLAGLTPPVTVQLRGAAGTCWGATFSAPDAAGPTRFKARSD
jgi:cysteine-rich repeat protein